MKNASKSKVLLCFRPVVDIDVMLESKPEADRPPSRRFACFPLEEKNGTKVSETKSMFSDKGSTELSENSTANHPPKRTLSRVIKALILEMILNRRANQKNRYLQDPCGSKRNYSTNTETSSTGDEKSTFSQASVDRNIQENKTHSLSSSSSSFGSGSSCLSQVTESRNLPKSYATGAKRKESSHQAPIKKQKNWDYTGIYLLVISSAVTILWGMILGIILTTTWLCFQSRPAASYRRPQEAAKLAKTGSRVYNKKRGHNGRTARKELQ